MNLQMRKKIRRSEKVLRVKVKLMDRPLSEKFRLGKLQLFANSRLKIGNKKFPLGKRNLRFVVRYFVRFVSITRDWKLHVWNDLVCVFWLFVHFKEDV
jgi:hypothetical protein